MMRRLLVALCALVFGGGFAAAHSSIAHAATVDTATAGATSPASCAEIYCVTLPCLLQSVTAGAPDYTCVWTNSTVEGGKQATQSLVDGSQGAVSICFDTCGHPVNTCIMPPGLPPICTDP